jgi:stromal membrane-associated protein
MASNRKDPALDTQHQAILLGMQQLPENKKCADCHGPAPRWASTNLGCFLCINCSGIHRKLGVHISTIRSTTLDTWTPAQVEHFQELGNARSTAVYEANLPPSFRRPSSSDPANMERFIRDKYEHLVFASEEHLAHLHVSGREAQSGSNKGYVGQSYHARRTHDPLSRQAMARHKPNMSHQLFVSHHVTSSRDRPGSIAGGLGRRLNQSTNPDDIAPYQRAETMKQILDMGFPPRVAARALEVSGGNLERAVEWVLQNEASVHDPPDLHKSLPDHFPQVPRISCSQSPPPPTTLVDFDEVPTVSSSDKKAAPSVVVAKNNVSDPPAWVACDDDFADFGAFESAAPSAQMNSLSAVSASSNGLQPHTGTLSPTLNVAPAREQSGMSRPSLSSHYPYGLTAQSPRGQAGQRIISEQRVVSSAAQHAHASRVNRTDEEGQGRGTGTLSSLSAAENIRPLKLSEPVIQSASAGPKSRIADDQVKSGCQRGSAAGGPVCSGASDVDGSAIGANTSPGLRSIAGSESPSKRIVVAGFEDPFASLASLALTESRARKRNQSVQSCSSVAPEVCRKPVRPNATLDVSAIVPDNPQILSDTPGLVGSEPKDTSSISMPPVPDPTASNFIDPFLVSSGSQAHSSSRTTQNTKKVVSLDDLLGL